MRCYNCGARQTKTIYPTYISPIEGGKLEKYVQKLCIVCGWKSNPTKIPEAIR